MTCTWPGQSVWLTVPDPLVHSYLLLQRYSVRITNRSSRCTAVSSVRTEECPITYSFAGSRQLKSVVIDLVFQEDFCCRHQLLYVVIRDVGYWYFRQIRITCILLIQDLKNRKRLPVNSSFSQFTRSWNDCLYPICTAFVYYRSNDRCSISVCNLLRSRAIFIV